MAKRQKFGDRKAKRDNATSFNFGANAKKPRKTGKGKGGGS